MFRILGSVNAFNEKMGLGLTHHDVNWIYNLHHLKGQGYYLKSRYFEVGLIQCHPDSNKGLNKDFLIVSGEWHDGLPCLTREGTPSGALGLSWLFQSHPFFFFFGLCLYMSFPLIHAIFSWRFFLFVFSNGFADKNDVVPNFSLVNQPSLDKILKAEVFVHSDG